MKSFLQISCLASLILLSACWTDQASNEAKDQAKQVADGMRTIRDAANPQGEDRLSDNEIKDYENKLAGLLDKGNQKSTMCSVLVLDVQNLITEKNMATQFYAMADQMNSTPDVAQEMREQAREIEKSYQANVDAIVIGSLKDWLFRFGQKSIGSLGAQGNKEAYQAVHHECMQKPLETVMNAEDKM